MVPTLISRFNSIELENEVLGPNRKSLFQALFPLTGVDTHISMLTAAAAVLPITPAGNCRYELDAPVSCSWPLEILAAAPRVAVQLAPPTESEAVPSLKE